MDGAPMKMAELNNEKSQLFEIEEGDGAPMRSSFKLAETTVGKPKQSCELNSYAFRSEFVIGDDGEGARNQNDLPLGRPDLQWLGKPDLKSIFHWEDQIWSINFSLRSSCTAIPDAALAYKFHGLSIQQYNSLEEIDRRLDPENLAVAVVGVDVLLSVEQVVSMVTVEEVKWRWFPCADRWGWR
ncbi:hypothetical protein L1987_45153 [Smallanthus sonchifolius]|uniref:Uncharacterized protein n=1 Tax=Smallanthus sonchifolius TaxID=185202 RepID=A0ACB9GSN6_9ASTR|nr:hypothetical protein L1987_45153 [Smallanthus sonchifolius]